MEDVVAVELKTDSGLCHHVVTWGRVQENVDPKPLVALVLSKAPKFGIHAVSGRVCGTLREAGNAPYFHEAIIEFAAKLAKRNASGVSHKKWRKKTDARMRDGRDLFYCGHPDRSPGNAEPTEA